MLEDLIKPDRVIHTDIIISIKLYKYKLELLKYYIEYDEIYWDTNDQHSFTGTSQRVRTCTKVKYKLINK